MLDIAQFLEDFGEYDTKTNTYTLPSTWESAGSGLPVAGLVELLFPVLWARL
jgi:hypothetical protein